MSENCPLMSGVCVIGVLAFVAGVSVFGQGAVQERRVTTSADALACAREAIGGSKTLADVRSLLVTAETTPDPGQPTGRPSADEVALSFPGQFRETSELRELDGRPIMAAVRRLNGETATVRGSMGEVREALDEGSVRGIRHSFARAAFMWLLRETSVTPLTWSRDVRPDGANIRIAAIGPDDFNIALILSPLTCQPVAVSWERAPNMGDTFRAQNAGVAVKDRYVMRLDLMDYRVFEGVRFPTRLRMSTDGVTTGEQRVTSIGVNPTLPSDIFAAGR